MDFDTLVARLEASLLPVVRKQEDRLRASGKYKSVEIISIRHGDGIHGNIHAMGIACDPIWATIDLERLAFCATLTTISGSPIVGRMDIQWSQIFIPRIGSGYLKKETRGFYKNLVTESEIIRFEKRWIRMSSLFIYVANRAQPSARWIRWLRGAPRDWHGIKENTSETK